AGDAKQSGHRTVLEHGRAGLPVNTENTAGERAVGGGGGPPPGPGAPGCCCPAPSARRPAAPARRRGGGGAGVPVRLGRCGFHHGRGVTSSCVGGVSTVWCSQPCQDGGTIEASAVPL